MCKTCWHLPRDWNQHKKGDFEPSGEVGSPNHTQLLDRVGISRGIKTSTKSVISFPREIPYIDTQLLDGVGISRGIETSTMVSDIESLLRAGVSKNIDISRGIETSTKSEISFPREIPYRDPIVRPCRYFPRDRNQHTGLWYGVFIEGRCVKHVNISRGIETSTKRVISFLEGS